MSHKSILLNLKFRKINEYDDLCKAQAQQLLTQSEEIGNSRRKLTQNDEDFEEKVLKIERDAERRIYEAEKVLKAQVILCC